MTKFFSKLKKTYFWPIFPIFGAKNFFPENPALLCTTSYWFLPLCKNLEKNNHTITRKHPDRQKDGQNDRKTLFHRTLPATARGSKTWFQF